VTSQAPPSAIPPEGWSKSALLHNPNGSGLAVGRTMAALLETDMQARCKRLAAQALGPYRAVTPFVAETNPVSYGVPNLPNAFSPPAAGCPLHNEGTWRTVLNGCFLSALATGPP